MGPTYPRPVDHGAAVAAIGAVLGNRVVPVIEAAIEGRETVGDDRGAETIHGAWASKFGGGSAFSRSDPVDPDWVTSHSKRPPRGICWTTTRLPNTSA